MDSNPPNHALSCSHACSALESGLVRFFCPKCTDRDRDQSTYLPKLKKTGPGPQKTEDRGLLQSLDQSWSEPLTTSLGPVFRQNMLNYIEN